MLSSSLIFAQNTISGSVSDENNNPIPGATVVLEGTTTGVVTDFDGNYQINASAGDQLTFQVWDSVLKLLQLETKIRLMLLYCQV
ncbi:MAG: hypothetical protein CM15mP126_7270 [Gammaproteobacteria bacterium]|nr:MAG: hypothetical protein CM15mP126_7270 [Gammaproteobacteria bacterium]